MKKHPLLRYLFIASLTAIILQFVSSGINLIKDPQKSLLDRAEKLRNIKPDIANDLEKLAYEYNTNEYFRIMPYVGLLFLILSLVAVVMMWQANEKGWYLYLFAEFAPYIITIVNWENHVKYYAGMSESAVIAMSLTFFAFDILFAGLYFFALKKTKQLNELFSKVDDNQQ